MNEGMNKEVIENALSQVGIAHMPLFLCQNLIREKTKGILWREPSLFGFLPENVKDFTKWLLASNLAGLPTKKILGMKTLSNYIPCTG